MGSTLLSLRGLLEDQIDVGVTDSSTDPTSTLLNSYINTSIRKIAREIKPRELLSATPFTANIVTGTNSVALPATVLVPDLVYVTDQNGKVNEVRQRDLKKMVAAESSISFFDSTNVGLPGFYTIRGTSILFNRYFYYSVSGGIKIFGVAPPTTLSLDADVTELPQDYNMLITYLAAILYYQKDDDFPNQQKYQMLAMDEKGLLGVALDTNLEDIVTLDPFTFQSTTSIAGNPNLFFGRQ